jgi:hypothetical protein
VFARTAVLTAALLPLGACGDPISTAPGGAEPVVRAYLYAGQPVNDIRLTWTVPISPTDTTAPVAPPPINDARLALVRNGVRYVLTRAPGDSGYYQYTGTDLVVREGDTWTLEGSVGAQALSARTIVPVRPSGARVGSSTLTVPNLTFGPGGFGGGRPDLSLAQTMVRWTRTPGALYFVTLDNIEANPVAIDFGLPERFRGRRRLVFPPTPADSLPINALGLPFLGRYRVQVWRVNEEYAALYNTLQQDSRDLNEPFTNITGGVGVFTAFAADTTSVVVVRPQ